MAKNDIKESIDLVAQLTEKLRGIIPASEQGERGLAKMVEKAEVMAQAGGGGIEQMINSLELLGMAAKDVTETLSIMNKIHQEFSSNSKIITSIGEEKTALQSLIDKQAKLVELTSDANEKRQNQKTGSNLVGELEAQVSWEKKYQETVTATETKLKSKTDAAIETKLKSKTDAAIAWEKKYQETVAETTRLLKERASQDIKPSVIDKLSDDGVLNEIPKPDKKIEQSKTDAEKIRKNYTSAYEKINVATSTIDDKLSAMKISGSLLRDIGEMGLGLKEIVDVTNEEEGALRRLELVKTDISDGITGKRTGSVGGYFDKSGTKVRNLDNSLTMGGFKKDVESQLSDVFSGKSLDNALASLNSAITDGMRLPAEAITQVSKPVVSLEGEMVKLSSTFETANGMSERMSISLNKMGKSAKSAMIEEAELADVNKKLFQSAESQGFSKGDLTDFRQVGESGVRRAKFKRESRIDDNGILQEAGTLELFIDKNGNKIPNVTRQFQTFTSGIMRNTRELLKWTLAMGLIYGPLSKAQELISDMIANEAALAKATRAMSGENTTSAQVFDDVYKSAKLAGESLTGTLDAFTQAYRAKGNITDQNKRYTESIKLLNESMTLSKLSTLSESEAIDTYSAALLQSDEVLREGVSLLDVWVNVANNANTDVSTLATGFAMMASTAENAGMGVSELSGALAAISSTSGVMDASGAGNVLKSMLGNYTSDASQQIFTQLGISVRDSNGELKDFLDISNEVHNLWAAGVINNESLGALSKAVGGMGVRRKKDAEVWFTSGIDVATKSAAVAGMTEGGEAADALGKQLETVETATTRLNNSFQQIAQTLGTDGGMLSIMSSTVDITTKVVEGINFITKAAGKASPAIYSLGLAMAMYRGKSGGVSNFLFGGFSGSPVGAGIGAIGGAAGSMLSQFGIKDKVSSLSNRLLFEQQQQTQYDQQLQQWVPTNGPKELNGFAKGASSAVIGGAGAVIGNVMEGDAAGAWGAAIGAAFGALLTETPMGAAVGASIGDGFVSFLKGGGLDKIDWEAVRNPDKSGGNAGSKGTAEENKDWQDRIDSAVYARFISERQLGTFDEWSSRKPNAGKTEDDYEAEIEKLMGDYGSATRVMVKASGVLEAKMEKGKNEKDSEYALSHLSDAGYEYVSGVKRQAYAATQNREFVEDLAAPLPTGAEIELKNTGDIGQGVLDKYIEELRSQESSGEITEKQLGDSLQAVSGGVGTAAAYKSEFGSSIIDSNEYVNNTSDVYDFLYRVMTESSTDEGSKLTQILNDTSTVQSEYDKYLAGEQEDDFKLHYRGQAYEPTQENVDIIKSQGQQDFTSFSGDIYGRNILSTANETPVANIGDPLASNDMFNQIYQRSLELAQQGSDLNPQQWEEKVKAQEAARFEIGDENGIGFQTAESYFPDYWKQASEQIISENPDMAENSDNLRIISLDIAKSQEGALMAEYERITKDVDPRFIDEEALGVIFNDNGTDVLHADNTWLLRAMERLVDINQDQLDGMYNIPDGATFWVPLTAAYYGKGGDGDTGEFDNYDGGNTVAIENDNSIPADDGMLGWINRQDRINKEMLDSWNETNINKTTEDQYIAENKPTDSYLSREYLDKPADGSLSKETSSDTGVFDGISALFKSLLGFGATGGGIGLTAGGLMKQPVKEPVKGSVDTKPATKLDLNISSNMNVMIDGRVVASIVKQYLASDLLKASNSMGGITKNVVI